MNKKQMGFKSIGISVDDGEIVMQIGNGKDAIRHKHHGRSNKHKENKERNNGQRKH